MTDAAKNVRFAESLHRVQDEMEPNQINMGKLVKRDKALKDVDPRTPNVVDEQFPTADLAQRNPRDKLMQAKLQLQEGADMGYTPFGKLEAKDADFEWLLEKEAAAERANMELWFAQNFDYMSPAQKAYAKKIFPSFYAARRKLLKKQVKNAYDIARIKLDGLEDFDDVKKQYLLDTGRLDLGPLQNLLHPEQGLDDQTKERFQRGIANPLYVFGNEALPMDLATRKKQAQNFAARKEQAKSVQLGIEGYGFPPFSGDKSNQSTGAWYKQLQSGLAAL